MAAANLRILAFRMHPEARKRVELWCERRCPSDVRVFVYPRWLYTLYAWHSGFFTHTGGLASKRHRKILTYAKTLMWYNWQEPLEHELLHILHPEWREETVERVAHAKWLSHQYRNELILTLKELEELVSKKGLVLPNLDLF